MKPDWRAVTLEALANRASLMRVFAAMGYKAHHGTILRGDIKWWQPAYLAASRKSPHRQSYAETNRAMRDAEVHVLSDDWRTSRITVVCNYAGEWRSADGAQRGDDLVSLAALRWSCRYGQAGARLARIIGLERIPSVAPMAADKVFAEVHAKLREPQHA